MLVPAFTGATALPAARWQCNYDLEIAAAKYLYSLPDGEVPLTFNFTGTIFYRGEDGRMQIVKVPWDCRGALRDAGLHLAGDDAPPLPQRRLGRAADETLDALGRHKAQLGLPSFDATVAGCCWRAEA